LLIRFPGGVHAKAIAENTQRIDIAPTLLDYLGIPIPGWMDGVSIISGLPKQSRPIFAVDRTATKKINGMRYVHNAAPPFYTLGAVTLISCNYWNRLSLKSLSLTQGIIKDYRGDCGGAGKLSKKESTRILLRKLLASDYELPPAWYTKYDL